MEGTSQDLCRLFVYGSMLNGQIDHSLLKGAELVASARTGPEFELFEVGAYGALGPEGRTSVVGEVYLVPRCAPRRTRRRAAGPDLVRAGHRSARGGRAGARLRDACRTGSR